MQRLVRSVPILVVSIVLAACSGTATTAPGGGSASCVVTTTVGSVQADVKDFLFSPDAISAKAGDTVTWTNSGASPHNPTLDDGSCTTGIIQPGAKGSLTFTVAGTYPYHCMIHPTMKGTITVTA